MLTLPLTVTGKTKHLPLRWMPTDPHEIPQVGFDPRAASSPNISMRIEAAAWKGRPVYF
jgi:hypothetical protein